MEATVNVNRKVLVVSYSRIAHDSRVRKQAEWLRDAGWRVSTLGLGDEEVEGTEHFQIVPREMNRFLRGIFLLVLTRGLRFWLFVSSRIPSSLKKEIPEFGAIVVNEIDLLPWVKHITTKHRQTLHVRHLDLHEFHEYERPKGVPTILSSILRRSHEWMLSLVGKISFTSVSTVASGIAELYEEKFGLKNIQLVYNSRPYYDLKPSPVEDDQIHLIYHGNAQADRGLGLLLEASAQFEPRFTLNLMLTGDRAEIDRLKLFARELGIQPNWFNPVPMDEVPQRINEFDLEVIFYPPKSPNLFYSFPNKFFEAIQGRLGLVIGESPSMLTEVEKFDIGFVVKGWSLSNLADKVNAITTDDVRRIKSNTERAALSLVTSNDEKTFLSNFVLSAK